jgi:hypothetical protein
MRNWNRLQSAVGFLIVTALFSIPPGALGQTTTPQASTLQNLPTKDLPSPTPLPPFYEDWDTLTLEGSDLHPLPPVLLERTDSPDKTYIREHRRLTWRPLESVDLYVTIPKGVKKPPVILYLYSYPEPPTRFLNDAWADGTTAGGYASVGFVAALTAERIPLEQPRDQWFVSQLHQSLAESVHDVQLILNYLASRGDLDVDHAGMFGVGSGGAVAILASAADRRLKAIDVFNPWGDWPDWLAKSSVIPKEERANFLQPEFLAGVAAVDPVRWLPKVKARMLRIQNVRTDTSVPEMTQKKVEEVAPDNTEIFQFGNYSLLLSIEPGTSVSNWIKEVLRPDSKYKIDPDKSKRIHSYPAKDKNPFELTPPPY